MKQTSEEFIAEVKAIPDSELIQMANKAISGLCGHGDRAFVMTVPPRKDDTDIVLSEIVQRFEKLSNQNKSE